MGAAALAAALLVAAVPGLALAEGSSNAGSVRPESDPGGSGQPAVEIEGEAPIDYAPEGHAPAGRVPEARPPARKQPADRANEGAASPGEPPRGDARDRAEPKTARTSGPEIVPRAGWQASPADESLMRRHAPRAIIIHHTDTAQARKRTLETKLKNLQSFSMNPGTISGTGKKKPAWGDVPYHYYIDVSGRVGEARDVAFAGDTNTGYKTDGFIQIVVEGKFDSETPDPKQIAALDGLVVSLAKTYRVAAKDITGHNDHAPSDCPGKKLKAHLPELRKLVGGGGPAAGR